MASNPDSGLGLPSGCPGVGVVERLDTTSSERRFVTEDFLLLPSFQDMAAEMKECKG